MPEFEAVLAEHPFFSGIAPVYLKILDGCTFEAHFDPGALIFRQGEEAERFYLIRQGSIALELFAPAREPVIIGTLGTGEILGESWLFPPYQCYCDARSRTPTRAVGFNAKCLRAICEDDHDLGFELMKRFSEVMLRRLQATRLQCVDIYLHPVGGRRK